jgi:hypothetical protein
MSARLLAEVLENQRAVSFGLDDAPLIEAWFDRLVTRDEPH